MTFSYTTTYDTKRDNGDSAVIDVPEVTTDKVTLRFKFNGEEGIKSYEFHLSAADAITLGLGLIKDAWRAKP